VAFTLALATTAPDWSVTVPLIAPRKVWLKPATAKNNITRTAAALRGIDASRKLNEKFCALRSMFPAKEIINYSIYYQLVRVGPVGVGTIVLWIFIDMHGNRDMNGSS
jgi:hypothetical protein